ncbi:MULTISPECIES: SRPBCC domain-containing protein [unclassified Pedobacter]|uniref:SRPBCC family protein n=1 Tax=unclassified Pedobacter TaxID=2628915 RepID=UPI001E584C7F|nr:MULTISPECIES: SRPBCC domain-containing protein [unclassified Pedobacter]
MNKEPLIVEKVYNVPAVKVWDALTNIEKIKKWYFQIDDFKAKVGFKFDFVGGPDDGPQYLHLCEITKVEEKKLIAYTWRYDNYPGNSEITWQLFDNGDTTQLKLTHVGLETFKENGKDFVKENFKSGWSYFLNDALQAYLEPTA